MMNEIITKDTMLHSLFACIIWLYLTVFGCDVWAAALLVSLFFWFYEKMQIIDNKLLEGWLLKGSYHKWMEVVVPSTSAFTAALTYTLLRRFAL